MKKTSLEEGMIYGGRRPADWLLAHNIVRPEDVDTRHGWNGFRRFWVPPDKKKEIEKTACALRVRLAAGPRAALHSARREGGVISRRRARSEAHQRGGSQGRATDFSG